MTSDTALPVYQEQRSLPEEYIVPQDSRYVPLQQQPYSCCPTSFQIVMLRHGMPLVPAELIGWHMGLVVPPEDAKFFYNPRISVEEPPIGYGTQVGLIDEYHPSKAMERLGIPFRVDIQTIDNFPTLESFVTALQEVVDRDGDVLFCLRWGDVLDEDKAAAPIDPTMGHVCVFDRLVDGKIRIVDPARGRKWRVFEPWHIYHSLQHHGLERKAGLWYIHRLTEDQKGAT
ncbi:MAG: hypothetical protein EOM26_02090 [Alphaproteobacteria bacterium]|nr:hypothetical protein [Alphaproteobacteria bacterium]